MNLIAIVRANLLRRKTRTIFTFLSIFIAFLLFGYLAAIEVGFGMGVEVSGADRLITQHRVSLVRPLPLAHMAKLEQVPGVTHVAPFVWFGGVYQDKRNFFAQMAVDPEKLFDVYPEYLLPDDQKRAWFANRIGAIAGRQLAERYGWKVGDRIPIQGTVWRKRDGSSTWEFVLEGIYEGARKGVDETIFFFHFDYFDESHSFGPGLVGWYVLRIDDPESAAEVCARIDDQFANSFGETKTSTETAWLRSFAKQVGDIGKIMRLVLAAVFFTILLVAGNTMAQSVRERTSELAVMKTLGFTDAAVLGMVLAESLVLAGLGGGLGLLVSWTLIHFGGDPTGFLSVFYVPAPFIAAGAALILLLGLAAGIVPALRAMRLSIVAALRRV
jgi:putative ABC transport system permease protein